MHMEEISQEESLAWKQYYEESQLKRSKAKKMLKDYHEQRKKDKDKRLKERKKDKDKRLKEFWTGTAIPADLYITTTMLVNLLESRIYTCIEAGFPAWRFEELALFLTFIPGSKVFSENKKMTLAEYFGLEAFLSEEE